MRFVPATLAGLTLLSAPAHLPQQAEQVDIARVIVDARVGVEPHDVAGLFPIPVTPG